MAQDRRVESNHRQVADVCDSFAWAIKKLLTGMDKSNMLKLQRIQNCFLFEVSDERFFNT